MSTKAIQACRYILSNHNSGWVLFEHGTCVLAREPKEDLESYAKELLCEFGPVGIGSEAGDFGTGKLKDGSGWVVTGHHPDVFTFVEGDSASGDRSELAVGLSGRTNRGADAQSLNVIHVEPGRRPN